MRGSASGCTGAGPGASSARWTEGGQGGGAGLEEATGQHSPLRYSLCLSMPLVCMNSGSASPEGSSGTWEGGHGGGGAGGEGRDEGEQE